MHLTGVYRDSISWRVIAARRASCKKFILLQFEKLVHFDILPLLPYTDFDERVNFRKPHFLGHSCHRSTFNAKPSAKLQFLRPFVSLSLKPASEAVSLESRQVGPATVPDPFIQICKTVICIPCLSEMAAWFSLHFEYGATPG